MDSFEILESLDINIVNEDVFYTDENGELNTLSIYFLINKAIKRGFILEKKVDDLTGVNLGIRNFSNLDMISFGEFCKEKGGNTAELLKLFLK